MQTLLLLAVFASSGRAASPAAQSPEDLGVVIAPDLDRAKTGKATAPTPQAAAAPLPTPKPAPQAPSSCPADGAIFLPTGFTFPALLPNAIYSYNTAAPVVGLLEDDVRFRERIVLPRGTRLVGNASTLHTLDRVNILWELAVLPEGCEFPFPGIAISAEDGSSGIKGKLEKHEDSIAAHIAVKSMLGAANTAATVASPMEGALTSGFTNEANQSVNASLNKVKDLESIYIHERMPIRVFVLRRFVRSGTAQP